MKIKFGTDGWRAIIAKEFTTENVTRITEGVALWLKQNHENPAVVLGHDCRFAGELFTSTIASVLVANGIRVFDSRGFVSTPMISLGVINCKASLGIIVTASHNPPAYNGYKLKGSYGGPLLPDAIEEIEHLIPDQVKDDYSGIKLAESHLYELVPLEDLYVSHVEANFDLQRIKNTGIRVAYDAMYGSGQAVIRRILPQALLYRCEHNPTFHGISPEPILKNMEGYAAFLRAQPGVDIGLATDGDADRIGLMDGQGNYIDSHHILLLLITYLHKYKRTGGIVCTGFSSTVKIRKLCEIYGIKLEVVPIGFKHICGIMLNEDVMVGGEESGGIAVKGHIPERDGIWMGLTLLEFLAVTGKSLNEIIREIYSEVGEFAFQRIDLKLSEDQKNRIVETCQNGKFTQFGPYTVQRLDTMDGFKYTLSEDEWVMIRASGTEPVLRTYAEAQNSKIAADILQATHEVILKI